MPSLPALSCSLLLTGSPNREKDQSRKTHMLADPLVGEERDAAWPAWELSRGTRCLAGAHSGQPEPSPSHPPSWPASTAFRLGGRHFPPLSTNNRNCCSLYADPLILTAFSRKILSPRQDALHYVYETTSINKWTLLFCKEAFNSLMLMFLPRKYLHEHQHQQPHPTGIHHRC